jgi:hypothetical protein
MTSRCWPRFQTESNRVERGRIPPRMIGDGNLAPSSSSLLYVAGTAPDLLAHCKVTADSQGHMRSALSSPGYDLACRTLNHLFLLQVTLGLNTKKHKIHRASYGYRAARHTLDALRYVAPVSKTRGQTKTQEVPCHERLDPVSLALVTKHGGPETRS